MKTGSGGSPSVSRRQTASNTGSPGFTGAARYRRGLKLYRFPESDWAVFSARGPLPGSLQTLNTYVWQTWYPAVRPQQTADDSAETAAAAALLGLL